MSNCEIEIYELMKAIEAKKKAELLATQATSELGCCFLKYQQTCVAYNEVLRDNTKLQMQLEALKALPLTEMEARFPI